MIAVFKRGSGFTKVAQVHSPMQYWRIPIETRPEILNNHQYNRQVIWLFILKKVVPLDGEEVAMYEFDKEEIR